jgi:hypothetical protein
MLADSSSLQLRALPMMPGELIVRLGERNQAPLEAFAKSHRAGSAAPGLRRQRLHGRERVFHAMVQFVDQQLLALLGGLALGDVLHDAHHVAQLSAGGAHRRRAHRQPDRPAVAAVQPLLHRIEFQFAGDLFAEGLAVRVGVVGMGMGEQPVGEQMLAAVSGDGADCLVDAQEAAVRRNLGNADRGMLIGSRQTLFLLEGMQARMFERGGRPLALRDVDKAIDRADQFAFGVAQRIDIERHDHPRSVHALDVTRGLSGRQYFGQLRAPQRRAVDIEISRRRGEFLMHLTRPWNPAPDLHGEGVILEDRALRVADEGRDRQHVEDAVGGAQHRGQRRGQPRCDGSAVVVSNRACAEPPHGDRRLPPRRNDQAGRRFINGISQTARRGRLMGRRRRPVARPACGRSSGR